MTRKLTQEQLAAIFAKRNRGTTFKLTKSQQRRLLTRVELEATVAKLKSRDSGSFSAPTVKTRPRPPSDEGLASRRGKEFRASGGFTRERIENLPLMRTSDILLIDDPIARKALFARREGLSIDDPLISDRGFNA